jgi:plastocyanin
LLVIPAMAGTAQAATIEATSGGGGYVWKPSTATIAPGGTVEFTSPSAVIPHGVTWTGGPEKPGCAGIPVDGEGTGWSGSCSFAQAGAYPFVCTVHPVEMKGTITVGSSGQPPGPPPPSGDASGSPLNGRASEAVRVAKRQRGATVRGTVDISQAGAGGRLEVLLFAKRAALSGKRAAGTTRVGRLVRSQLKAGKVSFAVALKGAARRGLKREGKLSLSVKLVVTPPGRAALTLKRGVVLHV